MKVEGRWADIETRGFVIVREFLNGEELAATVADGNRPDSVLPGARDLSTVASPPIYGRVRARMAEQFADIHAQTGIRLTHTTPTRYFRNNIRHWHLDDVPYWLFQDFTEYLNFWIPVVKPRADQSGLLMVEMDKLAAKAPNVYEAVRNRGCAEYIPERIAKLGDAAIEEHLIHESLHGKGAYAEPTTLVVERDGRREAVFSDLPIDTFAVTEDLVAGDAIVMRGDLLHKSQDELTQRIAITTRAMNGERLMRKSFLKNLSLVSRLELAKGFSMIPIVLAAFEHFGKDELPTSTVLDFMDAAREGKRAEAAAVAAVRPRLGEILDVPGPPLTI